MNHSKWPSWLALFLFIAGCAKGNTDPAERGRIPARGPGSPPPAITDHENHAVEASHARAAASASQPFFKLLRLTNLDEVPLTDEQVVETSSVIVRGTISSISDGRMIDYVDGPSNPFHTAVFQIRVSSVTKGDVGEFVYVEYLRGGTPVDALAEAAFAGEMLLFLHEADDWNPSAHKFVNEGLGVPRGEVLYTLRTQRGLLVDFSGIVEQPLAPDDPIIEGGTLEDVERSLEGML